MKGRRRGPSRDGWLLLTIIFALCVVNWQKGFSWVTTALIVLFIIGLVVDIVIARKQQE